MRQPTERVRRSVLQGLRNAARGNGQHPLAEFLTQDVRWHAGHPLGTFEGIDAFERDLWRPLRHAFPDFERRNDIFMAGVFAGEQWMSATGHYFGTFTQDWLAIPAHRRWASLRFGEVYRLKDDKIAEAFVLFDFVDLMRQVGCAPWRSGAGRETLAPGPATHDGVLLHTSASAVTDVSLHLVRSMLESLFEPDRASMAMERFWSPDMMWYGPAMIGATRGLDEFFRSHQEPWMTAFPDWSDALEAPFFADGHFACYAGWPSIRATHEGHLFGLAPTERTIDIRVMDWWRREEGLLVENWIMIDFPDLFLQLGIDLFERMRELAVEREPQATGD